MSKYIIFLVKSFLGNFYWHFAIFFWSHWRVVWLRDIYSYIADTSCLKKSVAGSFCQRKLTLWEVSLYCWLPVNFAWIQLLNFGWMNNSLTCLVNSKQVKPEASHTVIISASICACSWAAQGSSHKHSICSPKVTDKFPAKRIGSI